MNAQSLNVFVLLLSSEPEPQILDYVTQQHKLFIQIATSHALRLTGQWLWDTYTKVNKQMKTGNMEQLPEVGRAVLLSCRLMVTSWSEYWAKKKDTSTIKLSPTR